MSVVLDRSLDQRMLALKYANRVRTYRATLKQRIKHGEVSVHELLSDPPREILTMKAYTLLLAAPKVGKAKASRTMQIARIAQSKTVGGMSDRQRSELLAVLSDRRQP